MANRRIVTNWVNGFFIDLEFMNREDKKLFRDLMNKYGDKDESENILFPVPKRQVPEGTPQGGTLCC